MIQVNDRVICVDAIGNSKCDFNSPLVEGREYIIYAAIPLCCGQIVDVGLTAPMMCTYTCDIHGRVYQTVYGEPLYFNSFQFRKVEERTIEYTAEVKIEIPRLVLS